MTCLRQVEFLLLLLQCVYVVLSHPGDSVLQVVGKMTSANEITKAQNARPRCLWPTLRVLDENIYDVYVCNADTTGWTRYSSCFDHCTFNMNTLTCELNYSYMKACWLAREHVGEGIAANDGILAGEKDFKGSCEDMKDGLYVTMQHYKICKHGKDVENITDCCLNYSPCVVRARDWTMTCKGAVNPVYGLFCAVLDFEGVKESTPNQLKSLVSWALNVDPQGQKSERPFIGSIIRSANLVQYQIENLPDTPMYVHSYRKSQARLLNNAGFFRNDNNQPFLQDMTRNERNPEDRPRQLLRRRRHISQFSNVQRSKMRGRGHKTREARAVGKQDRGVAVRQLEDTNISGPEIVVASKNEEMSKAPVEALAHLITTVSGPPSNMTDGVFNLADQLKGNTGSQDLTSKTDKEETETTNLSAESMTPSKFSPFDERRKLDGGENPMKPSAESGIHDDRQMAPDSSDIPSRTQVLLGSAMDENASLLARDNPETSSDSVHTISGETRTETLNINKTALQFDSGKSQKTTKDKSVMTLTPIQLTTLVGRLASLFDPQRSQNTKPAPKNKDVPPTPPSETGSKIRHTQNLKPPFAIAHQLNDLMRFLYQLTDVQRTGMPGSHARQFKADDHRKQADKPKNTLSALLGKSQEADKEVAVEFQLMIEKKPKGGRSEQDSEMAVISVKAGSAPARQGPKAKGRRPEQEPEKQENGVGLQPSKKGSPVAHEQLSQEAAPTRAEEGNQRNVPADKAARGDNNFTGSTSSEAHGSDNPNNINILMSGESGVVRNLTPITQDAPLPFPKDSRFHTNSSGARKLSRDRRPILFSVFQTDRAMISNLRTRDFQNEQETTGAGKWTAENRHDPVQSFLKPSGKPEGPSTSKAQTPDQIFSPEQNFNQKPSADGGRTRYEGQVADHSIPVHVGLSSDKTTQVSTLLGDKKPQNEQAKSASLTSGKQGNGIHLSIRKRPGIVEESGPDGNAKSSTTSQNPLAGPKAGEPSFQDVSNLMGSLGNDPHKAQNNEATNANPGAIEWKPPTGMPDLQKTHNVLLNTQNDGSPLSDDVLTEIKVSGKTNGGDAHSPAFIAEENLISSVLNEAGNSQQNLELNPADSSPGLVVENDTSSTFAIPREKQSETIVHESTEMPSDERGEVSTSSKSSLSEPRPEANVNETPTPDDNNGLGGEGLHETKPTLANEQQPFNANIHELSLKGNSEVDVHEQEKQPSLGQHPKGETKMEASAPSSNMLRHLGFFLGPLRQFREQEILSPRQVLPLARRHWIMRRFLHPPHSHHIQHHGLQKQN